MFSKNELYLSKDMDVNFFIFNELLSHSLQTKFLGLLSPIFKVLNIL